MEAFPQFSPDGNAIAYLSDESNKWNIWVTTYPKPGPHCQVSKTGGMDPTWSPDGRKIMYQWGPAMFVVDVLSVPDCQVGEPTRLFKGAFTDRPGFGHDTTSDGKKFLMLEDQVSFTPSTSLNVITNLASEVQRHQKK